MTRDDMEIVSAVHRALVDKVGAERFAVWFGRGVRMEPCGKTLRIAAADTRISFLRKAFHTELLEAVHGVNLEPEFVVDTSVAVDVIPEGRASLPVPKVPTASAAPIHRPKRRFASLAEFLPGDANRVAFSAAQTAATRPGTYSPLTLVGPSGSGKSHLLEGIWRHVRTSGALSRVVYLTAEQFTNSFLEAIRHSGMPSFRHKVREAELLLIDDIHFFGGKQSTLVEFVNTVDTLLRAGRQLVLSADRPLAELKALGPDLVARLAGGLTCTLAPADFSVRRAILQQHSARQGLSLADDVLDWIAAQIGGDARQLCGAVNKLQANSEARLQAYSEARELSIDLPSAQEWLADLVLTARRPVRVPEIVEAVCDVLGVESSDLESSSKAAAVALPRMLVMFLARKWTRAGLLEISRSLGRKSHSTVHSAQQKVTAWLADGKQVSLPHGRCRLDDAIHRIECHLRLA